jgi:hypothetical protein
MRRRTKIVATLGPATDDPEVMKRLLEAGVDVVRINFSHGTAADHGRRVALARDCAMEMGREVAALADLQGPKIRIEGFRDGAIELAEGAAFVLDAGLGPREGDAGQVGISYKALPGDVSPDDVLLLDDGLIVLRVEAVEGRHPESGRQLAYSQGQMFGVPLVEKIQDTGQELGYSVEDASRHERVVISVALHFMHESEVQRSPRSAVLCFKALHVAISANHISAISRLDALQRTNIILGQNSSSSGQYPIASILVRY